MLANFLGRPEAAGRTLVHAAAPSSSMQLTQARYGIDAVAPDLSSDAGFDT